MKIRKLTAKDDLSEAIALLVRFFREEGFEDDPARIARHTHQLAALESCGLFLAVQDSAIGVATVSLEFGIEYGWWGEMGDLYVLPEYRGTGVSRALVAAAEDFLQERGASGYQVTVTQHGSETRGLEKFYEKLGFGSEGRFILRKLL